MVVTNTVNAAGRNDETVFSLSIADTNTHDLPDVDGDDSAGGGGWSGESLDDVMAKVVNNQDQSATVDLEATTSDDPSFNEAETVVSGVTVSSGGVESVTPPAETSYDLYRVVVSFGTAPTGNADSKVVFRAE